MTASLARILVLVICLFGFVAGASAHDRFRDYSGDWKLGHGHDYNGIYRFDGRDWRRMPGSATAIGDGWVIGTDRRGGGYGIYRWNGRGWTRVPGGAVSIGGSYDEPWVINDRGEQFFWNGYDWDRARHSNRRYYDDRRDHSYDYDDRRRHSFDYDYRPDNFRWRRSDW